jgi:hypothetical protein
VARSGRAVKHQPGAELAQMACALPRPQSGIRISDDLAIVHRAA